MATDELIQLEGVLVPSGAAFDDPRRADIEQIIQHSKLVGWRDALVGHDLENYVTDEARLLPLLEILPLSASATVLEIGPGFGQMTSAIAELVKRVDAVEVDMQQAKFCAIRAAQNGNANVRIIAGGGDGNLPVPSGEYDLVLMNLVIEWCALRSNLPHETVQRHYLSEINRALAPGGKLFISTKNRYSFRLLSGGRDEHMAALPFGSALPEAASRRLLKVRPEGKLHSRRHFKRMLMECGFSHLQELIAIPDMRWPASYVAASEFSRSHAARISDSIGRGGRLAKLLPLGLQKEFSPGLTFIATKRK